LALFVTIIRAKIAQTQIPQQPGIMVGEKQKETIGSRLAFQTGDVVGRCFAFAQSDEFQESQQAKVPVLPTTLGRDQQPMGLVRAGKRQQADMVGSPNLQLVSIKGLGQE